MAMFLRESDDDTLSWILVSRGFEIGGECDRCLFIEIKFFLNTSINIFLFEEERILPLNALKISNVTRAGAVPSRVRGTFGIISCRQTGQIFSKFDAKAQRARQARLRRCLH